MKNIFNKFISVFSTPKDLLKKQIGVTRLLFTSDLHGSNSCFMKFLNLARNSDIEPDVLLIGGDITGKDLIFIINDSNGRYYSSDRGKPVLLESLDEAKQHEKNVSDTGTYVYWCSREEYNYFISPKNDFDNISDDANKYTLSKKKNPVDQLLKNLIEKRVQEWVEIADERLKDSRCKFIMNAGNDDYFSIDSFIKNSNKVVFPEGISITINNSISIISCGYANKTPFACPRDVTEEELSIKIDSYINNYLSNGGDLKNCIFNFHCPPINSLLDVGPKLNKDKQPQMSAFGKESANVGSTAVRNAIEKYQPCLGLHGHIHESPGIDKINKTIIINPGSEYQSGILKFATIDFKNDELINFYLRTAL